MSDDVIHPIKNNKERSRWIREQINSGKGRGDLFREIEAFYPVKNTLAREIAAWLTPTEMEASKSKRILLALLMGAIGIVVFLLQIQMDSNFTGSLLAYADKLILPVLLWFFSYLLFLPVAPGLQIVSTQTRIALVLSLVYVAIQAFADSFADLEEGLMAVGLLLLAASATILSYRLKKQLIPNYRVSGPKKDREGNFLF